MVKQMVYYYLHFSNEEIQGLLSLIYLSKVLELKIGASRTQPQVFCLEIFRVWASRLIWAPQPGVLGLNFALSMSADASRAPQQCRHTRY